MAGPVPWKASMNSGSHDGDDPGSRSFDEFLARARHHSNAEAILLTGYADLKAVIGAVNKGRIMAYAPKPWEPAALSSMVAAAYQRPMLAREPDEPVRIQRVGLDADVGEREWNRNRLADGSHTRIRLGSASRPPFPLDVFAPRHA